MMIRVKNPGTGKREEIKIGFSWTAVFFGVFVPLARMDWKWLGITLGVGLVLTWIGLGSIVPFLLGAFAANYNKFYATDLYKEGYRGLSKEENEELENYIGVSNSGEVTSQ